MIDRSDLKRRARGRLRVIYWPALLVCLMAIFLGDNVVSSTGFASFTLFGFLRRLTDGSVLQLVLLAAVFQYFVAGPITVGRARYFLRLTKDAEDTEETNEAKISDIFFVFRTKHYWRITYSQFLAIFFVAAAFALPVSMRVFFLENSVVHTIIFLLLFIPGIRLYYRFRLLPYILAQNPDLTPGEALSRSSSLAMGRRWEIFKLDMSFFGWYILAPLAFGVGVFFVIPYHEATMALYFHEPRKKPEMLISEYNNIYDPDLIELSK